MVEGRVTKIQMRPKDGAAKAGKWNSGETENDVYRLAKVFNDAGIDCWAYTFYEKYGMATVNIMGDLTPGHAEAVISGARDKLKETASVVIEIQKKVI